MAASSSRKTPPPARPRVALVYTRVSTAKQAEQGVSLDAQELQCKDLAKRMGLEIDGVFSDAGLSGALAPDQRPAFASLLERRAVLEARGLEVVVLAYDFSRVSRSLSDLLDLVDTQRMGLLLNTVKENLDVSTPAGQLVRSVLAALNEFNRQMTSERTKDALAYVSAEIEEDKAAGRAPRKQLGQRRVEQLVDPEVVLTIVQCMQVEKMSQRRTCERLEFLGLKTPKGSTRWNLDSLQRLIAAMQAGKFDLQTGRAIAEGSEQAHA